MAPKEIIFYFVVNFQIQKINVVPWQWMLKTH